jgi:hypothetical protein
MKPWKLQNKNGSFYFGIAGPIYLLHIEIGRLTIAFERKRG